MFIAYTVAAFVAGLFALAMPCCFSVLLPSYFAQSFKEKSRLVGMTAVFSTGIATVMLPLAFGITYLGRTLGTNHELVFVIGGLLMTLIGFWTLWGKGMLPRINFPINLSGVPSVGSVFALGFFSGAATTCCAPVLAGILIFAALSSSLLEGLVVGFTYVVGMVFPLFVLALAWDRFRGGAENPFHSKLVGFKLFGHEFSASSSKIVSGAMFLVMGVVNIWVGFTGTMIPAPGAVQVLPMQAQFQKNILNAFSSFPINSGTIAGIGIGVAGLTTAILISGRFVILGRRADKHQPL